MHTLFSTGGYVQSEPWVLIRPRVPGTYPLVVALHGAGGEEWAFHAPGVFPGVLDVTSTIVESGFVVLCPDTRDGIGADGSHTWGNDGSTTTLDNAITYAKTLPGVGQGKVGILGTSMGSLTGLNYRRRFAANVAGMVAVSGAVDVDYHHSGNDAPTGKYQTEIDVAAGGAAGYAAWATTHDPNVFAVADPATYLPMAMWHASDDAVVPYARTETFATAVGATFHTLASGAHTDAAWSLIDRGAVVAFLRSLSY